MAGITAYVGATHLLVFLRVLREREHLAFAALCGGVLAYELLSAGLYSADTPLHATGWQVGLAWAVVFSCAAVVWFTAEHLGVMSRAIGAGLAVVLVPLLAALALTPRSWLVTSSPLHRQVDLPFGLSVTYHEMAIGPLYHVVNAIALAAIVFAAVLGLVHLRTPKRAKAVPLLVATGIFLLTAISDVLAAAQVISFVYLVEYGFGALVALMTFRLSSGLVRVRAAERELEDREHSYREIFNATSEAIFVVDARSGAICDANDAVTQLLGYSREEALALGAGDLTTSTTASGQQLGLARFAEAGERGQARFEGVTRTRDGRELWVEVTLRAASLGGEPRILAVMRDVSDRKRAETALSETRHFSEQVVDAIPGIIYIFDLVAGRAVYSNRNVGDLLGYTPEEIAAMGESLLARIVMPEDLPTTMRLLGRWEAAGDEDVLTSEYRVRTRDGELRWWMGRDKVFSRSPDGRVAQIIGSVHDITDRRRAELALRESEERYRTLVEASPSGILLLDRASRIVFANPAACRICGVPDSAGLIGRDVYEMVVAEDQRALQVRTRAVLARRVQARPFRLRLRRPDGEVRHLELVGVHVYHDGRPAVLGVGNDVTDQVAAAEQQSRLEGQLRQAQKLEAVGRLAGGVAHDFNNLLQAMLGYSELLATQVEDPVAVSEGLAELAEHAQRGARLTRQLLVFSRREATHMETLDLGTVVAGATTLVRRLLREQTRLELSLASRPLPVWADRGQIEQVVVNLAVNAADAMPDGGVLTLRTGETASGRVWFEVSDTGHGIPEDLRDHIFDPFFTTKSPSQGTGLGLSVVHAIVAQHRGDIELDSRVGEGSTFRILLPRLLSSQSPAGAAAEPGAIELVRGGGRRVLVVEDEKGARDVLAEILDTMGFDVVAVGTLAEARAQTGHPPFSALLCDIVLPDGAGDALAAELQARWPGLVVILMSGYAQDATLRSAVGRGEVRFLQKPFGMSALARELTRALGEPSAPGPPPATM